MNNIMCTIRNSSSGHYDISILDNMMFQFQWYITDSKCDVPRCVL